MRRTAISGSGLNQLSANRFDRGVSGKAVFGDEQGRFRDARGATVGRTCLDEAVRHRGQAVGRAPAVDASRLARLTERALSDVDYVRSLTGHAVPQSSTVRAALGDDRLGELIAIQLSAYGSRGRIPLKK